MSLSDLLLLALPAVFLTGLSKGGFGGALGGIAVPLLALASTPKQAAAVMLPILCLADLVGLKAYWGRWDVANLKVMMPGALIGIGIGALTFELLNENLIGLIIGVIAVSFVLLGLINGSQTPRPLHRGRGTLLSEVVKISSDVARASPGVRCLRCATIFSQPPGARWLPWVASELYRLSPAEYAAMVRRELERLTAQ